MLLFGKNKFLKVIHRSKANDPEKRKQFIDRYFKFTKSKQVCKRQNRRRNPGVLFLNQRRMAYQSWHPVDRQPPGESRLIICTCGAGNTL
jgi:hypothetical protein